MDLDLVKKSTVNEDSLKLVATTEWSDERMNKAIDVIGSYLIPITSIFGIVANCLTGSVVVFMGLDTSALVYMLLIAIGDSISVFIDGVLNIA